MYGSTPGAAPGESTELAVGGSDPFQFEDGRGYTVIVTVIARGTIGTPKTRSFQQTLSVLRDAGVSSIEASGVQENIGSVAAGNWTLTATIGVAPDRLVLTFSTGITTAAVRVTAKVTFTEIHNP
jgi:hypothetical protein